MKEEELGPIGLRAADTLAGGQSRCDPKNAYEKLDRDFKESQKGDLRRKSTLINKNTQALRRLVKIASTLC